MKLLSSLILFVALSQSVFAVPKADALALENNQVTLTFRAEASAVPSDFSVEGSPDLGETPWVVLPSVITNLGGEDWQAVLTQNAEGMFFRVLQNGVVIVASFPSASATVREGESNSLIVNFNAPFTGTLNYAVNSIPGQVEVVDSTQVEIPLAIQDDAEVNSLTPISVQLQASAGETSYRLDSSATQNLFVEDNDQFRTGGLTSADGSLKLPIRLLLTQQNGANAARLKSSEVGLFPVNPSHPDGDWPFTNVILTPTTFSGSVTILIPAEESSYQAETQLSLTLNAVMEDTSAVIWEGGTFTLATTVSSKTHLNTNRTGSFILIRELPVLGELAPPSQQ